MKKLVSNQISPHFKGIDALYAISQIKNIGRKKNVDFSEFLGTKNYFLFNAARSGLGILVDTLNVPKEKKIGIPAFCCAVMATPFLSRGYEIEWIDTDERGIISISDFEKKRDNISLIITVHTFGQHAPISEIFALAKEKNIFVVEDGAHFFDTNLEYCDAKLLSFGREKDVSCVSGGALLFPNDSPLIKPFQNLSLSPQKKWETFQLLLHPLIFSLAIPLWYAGWIGKAIVWIGKKLKLIPLAVTKMEKEGHEDFPCSQLSFSLQKVLMRQLKKRKEGLHNREIVAKEWQKTFTEIFPDQKIIIPENFFRVIVIAKNARKIKNDVQNWGFDLNEWEGYPIAPKGVHNEYFNYLSDSCPNAEQYSQKYITFPCNPRTSEQDILRFRTMWKLLQ